MHAYIAVQNHYGMNQKLCSNRETHIQIIEFICFLNMDFAKKIFKTSQSLIT